jgi:hypothetical protein
MKTKKQKKSRLGADIVKMYKRKTGPHKDRRNKRNRKNNLWKKDYDL